MLGAMLLANYMAVKRNLSFYLFFFKIGKTQELTSLLSGSIEQAFYRHFALLLMKPEQN